MIQNISTKDLSYFKEVADEQSISKAARKLYIAQPSLSQYIRRLEESVGSPLFRRTPSGMVLTYVGERYYAMTSQIMKSLEDFSFELTDITELNAGMVRFGITQFLGTHLLPYILPEFSRLCPNITVQMTEVTSSLQEEALLKNRIDFSLMHVPLEKDLNSALRYTDLAKDPFVVVLSDDSPLLERVRKEEGSGRQFLDPAELAGESFVMINQGQRIRQIGDHILEQAGILHPQIRIETTSLTTAIRLICNGLGVGLLPRQYLSLVMTNRRPVLCSIPESYHAVWTICVATLKDAYLTKADNLFLSITTEAVSRSLEEAAF